MLAAFLLLRREMLDELGGFDPGFRLYGEDIDLCYRAAKAGWERWYVPAGDRDPRARGRHRPPLPHAPDLVALARHRALRPQTPRAPPRTLSPSRSEPNAWNVKAPARPPEAACGAAAPICFPVSTEVAALAFSIENRRLDAELPSICRSEL